METKHKKKSEYIELFNKCFDRFFGIIKYFIREQHRPDNKRSRSLLQLSKDKFENRKIEEATALYLESMNLTMGLDRREY